MRGGADSLEGFYHRPKTAGTELRQFRPSIRVHFEPELDSICSEFRITTACTLLAIACFVRFRSQVMWIEVYPTERFKYDLPNPVVFRGLGCSTLWSCGPRDRVELGPRP